MLLSRECIHEERNLFFYENAWEEQNDSSLFSREKVCVDHNTPDSTVSAVLTLFRGQLIESGKCPKRFLEYFID